MSFPFTMELFPSHPDFSPQISSPDPNPTPPPPWPDRIPRADDSSRSSRFRSGDDPPRYYYQQQGLFPGHHHHHLHGPFRSQAGVPVFEIPNFSPRRLPPNTCTSSTTLCRCSHGSTTRSRLVFPKKLLPRRGTRAPRMRWTSALHSRFIHAVELLGGHERATPKTVLELMDVRDLTLAHVKSHLQMYRTVKTTDVRATVASSPGQSEVFDNPNPGDNNSEDLAPEIQDGGEQESTRRENRIDLRHDIERGNPSREDHQDWLQMKLKSKRDGVSIKFVERDYDPKSFLSHEKLSSSSNFSNSSVSKSISPQRPNLVFTLGR